MKFIIRNQKALLFAALVGFYFQGHGARLFAGSKAMWSECDDVCASSNCTDGCYLDPIEFENGNQISCYEYGTYDTTQSCCGDGVCDASHNEDGSPTDSNETGACAVDCGAPPPGGGDGNCDPVWQTGCTSGQYLRPERRMS